jgi:hypothetical protein
MSEKPVEFGATAPGLATAGGGDRRTGRPPVKVGPEGREGRPYAEFSLFYQDDMPLLVGFSCVQKLRPVWPPTLRRRDDRRLRRVGRHRISGVVGASRRVSGGRWRTRPARRCLSWSGGAARSVTFTKTRKNGATPRRPPARPADGGSTAAVTAAPTPPLPHRLTDHAPTNAPRTTSSAAPPKVSPAAKPSAAGSATSPVRYQLIEHINTAQLRGQSMGHRSPLDELPSRSGATSPEGFSD